MYPYKITFISLEVLSFLIQKTNVTSRKIAYFIIMTLNLKIISGPNCHEYEIVLASRNETFKQIAAQGDFFIIFFLLFRLWCVTWNLCEIHDSHQEKRAYQAITRCTPFTLSRQWFSCFTNHALWKGVPLGVTQETWHVTQKQKSTSISKKYKHQCQVPQRFDEISNLVFWKNIF